MSVVAEGASSAPVEIVTDMIDGAYAEGAFFAETDWQAALRETLVQVQVMPVAPGYSSMADHCRTAWDFIRQHACPEWDRPDARFAFFLGYEEAAKVLAAAGEAGYEILAEAGTVDDTAGWVLHSQPWPETDDAAERAVRAMRAAETGAACWAALAESGEAGAWRAEQAADWALEVAECLGQLSGLFGRIWHTGCPVFAIGVLAGTRSDR